MDILEFVNECERELAEDFAKVEAISLYNQEKVLTAFRKGNLALRHFAPTNGYGYDDIGRDKLAEVYADIFGCESALVSPMIVSGTHALTLMLFGVLRPGDALLSISGAPYDTLQEVICGENNGSLKDFGIDYREVALTNGNFDTVKIENEIRTSAPKAIFIGRSRGYEWRDALSIEQIATIIEFVKSIDSNIVVMVDNCYGEFVSKTEPTQVGADLMAGSLNKNPGGGLVNTGGYIAGKKKFIDLVSYRMTAPSIGSEVGSYAYGYQYFFQGLFMAPHIVCNAIKGSMLFGCAYSKLGYETMPLPHTRCHDIIRSIKFDTPEELIAFIRAIQYASPVDGNVVPYPWDMPGYESQVIMAAGTFVQGASIELSADSPIREPYIAYLQGGLTYEHVKLALISTLKSLNKDAK